MATNSKVTPASRAKYVKLPVETDRRLREALKRFVTPAAAAEGIGVQRDTIARALAGYQVLRGTVALIEQGLDRLGVQ